MPTCTCPQLLLHTIFVASVTCGHNFCTHSEACTQFELVTNNVHILNNVYKNGSIFISSCRISSEKLLPKMEAKPTMGTILYTKYRWRQKCTLFHFLATFLATFENCGHNSLLDENRCTQM